MPINRSCRAHFYCVLCVFAHWDGLPAKTALRSHGLSLSLSLHLHIVDDRESHLPIWYYWCWQRLFVFAFHAKCWLMALPGLTFLLCVHPLLLISPRFLSLCLHKIISAPRLSYQSHVGFSECHIGLFHTINSNRQQRQPTTAMWSDVIVICGSLIISMCQYVWLCRVFFRLSFLFFYFICASNRLDARITFSSAALCGGCGSAVGLHRCGRLQNSHYCTYSSYCVCVCVVCSVHQSGFGVRKSSIMHFLKYKLHMRFRYRVR